MEGGDKMGGKIQISLVAARVNAELKQEEAANKIGISVKALRNYELGIEAIPRHVFKTIARVYGLPENAIRVPIVDDGEYDDPTFMGHNTF